MRSELDWIATTAALRLGQRALGRAVTVPRKRRGARDPAWL